MLLKDCQEEESKMNKDNNGERRLCNIRVVSYCLPLSCGDERVATDAYYGWFFGNRKISEDVRKDPSIRRAIFENERAMYGDYYEFTLQDISTHVVRLRGYY